MSGIVSTFNNIKNKYGNYINGYYLSKRGNEILGIYLNVIEKRCMFQFIKNYEDGLDWFYENCFYHINLDKTNHIRGIYKPIKLPKNIPSKQEIKYNLIKKSLTISIIIFKFFKIPKCLYMNLILDKFFIKIEN